MAQTIEEFPVSLSDRERVAWHEAGHTVAGQRLGIRVRSVSIVPEGRSGGRTDVCYPRWWRNAPAETVTPHREGMILRYAIMTLAGLAAEEHKTGQRNLDGAWADLNENGGVYDCLDVLGGCQHAALKWLLDRARLLLDRPEVWCQVQAVADALLARETLREKEIRQVTVAALEAFEPRYARLSLVGKVPEVLRDS
jgi:Peptidase family M41